MSNPKDYTHVAAQAFLDAKHEGPEYVSPNDNNDYTLGKVKKHNVVIAVLPEGEYGISSAASVARDMLHSFPNVRVGLIVGIGGGAPSLKHDIRLGDIVVSAPRDGKGGVFQYDFGKAIQDQSLRPTGFLNQPPMVLRTAVNGLKAQYESEGHQLEEAINSILEKKKRLRKKYQRPGRSSDRLYQTRVTHPPNNEANDGANCAIVYSDDPSNLIPRHERSEDEDNPAIHYGLIASANQLLKDALLRDKFAKENDVLCFEMEAAGLMNQFPCLVIRGICDYSDTHKNKEWQGYAAMVAAAYAKDLLCRIPPNKVEAERKIPDLLSSIKKDVNEMRCDVKDARTAIQDVTLEQRREKIERWLSPSDPSTNYNKASQRRQDGTGLWFLQSDAFAKWKTQRSSFLWLYGIPGCGKTILSSTIIEDLKKTLPNRPLLYFYFDFNDANKQILDSMVRSLISQLYRRCEVTWKQLDSLFSSCEDGRSQPSCELLCKVLLQMIDQVKEVCVVLDALDECRTRKGPPTEGLLSWERDLLDSEQRNVHLLVTSRPEQDIKMGLSNLAHSGDVVPIQDNLISDDIRRYVRTRVREGDDLKRWRSYPDVQDEIETQLMQKANGMFRWAACQIDALENCLDYRTLKIALVSLPNTLDETYSRILRAVPSEHRQYATRILQFLTFSERPLRIEEAVDAIAVDTEGNQYFSLKYRMPDPQEISRYCSSLVVVVSATEHSNGEDSERVELQLAHFSVKEYLTSNRLDSGIAQDFQETTARASIAKVCLAYLLHFDQDVPPKQISEAFPLARYSARFWMTNALVAEAKDKRLQYFVVQLFCYRRRSYEICYSLYRPDRPWDNAPDNGGDELASALYYAALGGLVNAVMFLLNRAVDVNAEGGYYGNALQAASERGHEQIVKLLLDKGAYVNAEGGEYSNALQAASARGHKQIVELLLNKGAR
ncbi:purine and uridine phosphorylase [Zopfia rhizophila CBS 207.26]|uniref:Purine and uridine phosphorylase n=1 Tax=Zopfia rhizophila CBS 207.26 TaxID=1314779 RepID=A0A6A6DMR9_9PEZI|nr:purine and uridine phosphorylase [Zopfia rhizophila CBS 207.26]